MMAPFWSSLDLPRRTILTFIYAGWLSFALAYSFNPSTYPSKDVITIDVCIIGGGASGVYAAVGLHDLGKSVVVVEQKDRLGGHTETYIDPATQAPIDIGVVVWHDIDIVRNFLARLNVSSTLYNFAAAPSTQYADFSTGKAVNFTLTDASAALLAYAAQLAQYPYLSLGFDLPDPVPEDLLLPFGDFVTKYGLQGVVFTIYNFAQGLGDILKQPTIYVMKNVGLDTLQSLQAGFRTTVSHDNSEVYIKAGNVLGVDNVLLSSKVVATDRQTTTGGYVKIVVKTPDGLKLIQAKKIVLAIPPKLSNLAGFDLTSQESALFKQFGNSGYYTGVLRDSGIPDDLSVVNVNANTPYNLPILPGVYSFVPTGVPGLQSVKYGSPSSLTDEQVVSDIFASVKKLGEAGTVPTTTPTLAVFASHIPFELVVSASAIAKGFYRELYALQGCSSTYYTGAAFHTHDSSLLWRFIEGLLPEIVA